MDAVRRHPLWSCLGIVLFLFLIYAITIAPPFDFPVGETVSISSGSSLPQIANELASMHVVEHAGVLSLLLRISGESNQVQEGAYLFNTRENAITVAYRLATAAYGLPPAYITFPEGVTVRDIALKVAAALPNVSAQSIIATGTPQEGYLFPDTYLFAPNATADSIVETMRDNFSVKLAPLMPGIEASGHSLSDIITMASLVEKEGQSDTDKRMIAGILWNRIALGMPLQVDAVFGYIYGRDGYAPSLADLSVASPYNTYIHRGLPPGPICNPGLQSIEAVLYPATTTYLYYLTDKNGVMHYATTYAEQQANERKYLD
jgi:UPF0755 protein